MNNLLLVDVPDSGDELTEQLACVLFAKVAMREDVVEELVPGRVFEDYTDILVRLDNVVETDDVGMFEGLGGSVSHAWPAKIRKIEHASVGPQSRARPWTCARWNRCSRGG